LPDYTNGPRAFALCGKTNEHQPHVHFDVDWKPGRRGWVVELYCVGYSEKTEAARKAAHATLQRMLDNAHPAALDRQP